MLCGNSIWDGCVIFFSPIILQQEERDREERKKRQEELDEQRKKQEEIEKQEAAVRVSWSEIVAPKFRANLHVIVLRLQTQAGSVKLSIHKGPINIGDSVWNLPVVAWTDCGLA